MSGPGRANPASRDRWLGATDRGYVVCSPFASTGLVCSEAVAEQIRLLAAPYMSVERGECDPGDWRVAAGLRPPESAVDESVRAEGETSVEYAIDHEGRCVYHLAPLNDAWVTQSLLRATRAVHRSLATQQGVLLVHAGLVQLGEIGVALVGASRSGKTSLIMASVLNGEGVMVCNDDLALAGGPEGNVLGVGWPRSISVRLDTFDVLFGRKHSTAIQSGLTHPANKNLLTLRDTGIEPHGTALVYPWEYAQLLSSHLPVQANVDAIVFLGFAGDRTDTEFAQIPAEAAGGLLDQSILTVPNKHLNIFGHEPPTGRCGPIVSAVLDLPAFSFRYFFPDARQEVKRLSRSLAAVL